MLLTTLHGSALNKPAFPVPNQYQWWRQCKNNGMNAYLVLLRPYNIFPKVSRLISETNHHTFFFCFIIHPSLSVLFFFAPWCFDVENSSLGSSISGVKDLFLSRPYYITLNICITIQLFFRYIYMQASVLSHGKSVKRIRKKSQSTKVRGTQTIQFFAKIIIVFSLPSSSCCKLSDFL